MRAHAGEKPQQPFAATKDVMDVMDLVSHALGDRRTRLSRSFSAPVREDRGRIHRLPSRKRGFRPAPFVPDGLSSHPEGASMSATADPMPNLGNIARSNDIALADEAGRRRGWADAEWSSSEPAPDWYEDIRGRIG